MADDTNDGLTEAERNYFSTGEVSEALVAEQDAPSIVPAETPVADPVADPVAVAPVETPSETPAETDDDATDIEVATPKRISFKKYEAAEQARVAAEQRLQEQAIRQARVEERLALLQQALQPQETPVEAPDPEKDIFGYVKHLESRIAQGEEKISTYEQQISTGQQEAEQERRYFTEMNDFATQEPNLVNAYNFLLRVRAAELMAPRYPQATFEQLLRAEVPPEIGAALRAEERSLYEEAFENKINPGAQIMRYAQLRGYRPPAAPAAPAPAPTEQKVNTPKGPQSAAQVVQAIQQGQKAATSLSNASGTSPNTEMTPEVLAAMSDDEFAAYFNALQDAGNKTKLMSLMGH